MTVHLSPIGNAAQFFTTVGAPLNAGQLFTYAAGTVTPQATYTDSTGGTPNANPITLGVDGRTPQEVWLTDGLAYKFILKDSLANIIGTYDNISGIGDLTSVNAAISTAIATLSAQLASNTAGSTGASLIGFRQIGTGATARTVVGKLQDIVSVDDFGAIGNGTSDDSGAFSNAAASLGALGGAIAYRHKHLIDANLTIPSNVTVKGPMELVGSPGTNISAPYGSMAAIILNGTKTITLGGGAGLDGCLVYRKGMTFPAADGSAFTGTAVTAGGDDCFLFGCQVLGFNLAYFSDGFQRPRIQNTWMDCQGGTYIANCGDIARVEFCHSWAFSTVATLGPPATNQRSGVAFEFNNSDWNKVTDCFDFGHFRGFRVTDCDSSSFLSCGSDDFVAHAGSIGFEVAGTCLDNRMLMCQAAAKEKGYYYANSVGNKSRMVMCDSWGCDIEGILIASGDVEIYGGTHRNTTYGIEVASATSIVFIDGVQFNGIATRPIHVSVGNSSTFIGGHNDYGSWADGSPVTDQANKVIRSVGSVDPLPLPATGDIFQVTGVANFGTLLGGYADRLVTLKFTGVLTVSDAGGAGGVNTMNLAGNFTTAADSTLQLMHDGSRWIEIGRSSN